jgi:hypothetical protein
MDGMDDFKREYQTDPYTAAITNMMLDAWAMGYEAARREVERESSDDRGVIDRDSPFVALCLRMREQSYGDLRVRAAKEMLSAQREASRRAITAMAKLARMVPGSEMFGGGRSG